MESSNIHKQSKATLTIGKYIETGKLIRKTFTATTEDKALDKMYKYKLDMKKAGKTINIKRLKKQLQYLLKKMKIQNTE